MQHGVCGSYCFLDEGHFGCEQGVHACSRCSDTARALWNTKGVPTSTLDFVHRIQAGLPDQAGRREPISATASDRTQQTESFVAKGRASERRDTSKDARSSRRFPRGRSTPLVAPWSARTPEIIRASEAEEEGWDAPPENRTPPLITANRCDRYLLFPASPDSFRDKPEHHMLDVVVPFLDPLGGFPQALLAEDVWSAPWLQPIAPDDQNKSTIPHPSHKSLSAIFENQQDVFLCGLGMVCDLCVPGHRKQTDTRIMNATKEQT